MLTLSTYQLTTLANISLRGSGIMLKFGLIIAISTWLSLENVGIYGLFAGAVAIYANLCGLGVRHYFARMIANAQGASIGLYIKQHFALNVAFYFILFFPVWYVTGLLDLLKPEYIIYFLLISMLEHAAEDIYSTLLSLNSSLKANIIFFLKAAAWIPFVVMIGFVERESFSLLLIFQGWLTALVVVLLLGLWMIRHTKWTKQALERNWTWVATSHKVALPFFGSLSLGVLALYADRFILNIFMETELVGVFILIWTFANALYQVVKNGVIAQFRTNFVRLAKQQQFEALGREVKKCFTHAIGLAVILSLAIAVVFPWLQQWFNKPIISDYIPALWLMLAANILRVVNDIAMQYLYAQHKDRTMFNMTWIFLIMTFISCTFGAKFFGLFGVAFALLFVAIIRGITGITLVRKIHRKYALSL